MLTVLTIVTIIVVVLVALVLATYLTLIALTLRRANRNAGNLAVGLGAVQSNTRPLPEHLTTINGALGALLTGLDAIDRQLAGIAGLLHGGRSGR
jgi:hypothetical protein